jgi:holo-ACP synthase CitX
MSYAKLRSELLRARDVRERSLQAVLARGTNVVFLSTAIPGADKTPAGGSELFDWALQALENFPGAVELGELGCDALGHYAILNLPWPASRIKLACVALEEQFPVTRLLDLDVYDASGNQLGRTELGLPPRRCLVCSHSAGECIRLRRHDPTVVIEHAHRLLSAGVPHAAA